MTADETTAARVAEPMSEERIAELREDIEDVRRETSSTVHRSLLNTYVSHLSDCLDEIKRLRAVIAERDARDAELIRLLKAVRNHPVSDNRSRQRWCDVGIAMLTGEEMPNRLDATVPSERTFGDLRRERGWNE